MNRVELYPLFQEFKAFGEGLVDGVNEIMHMQKGEFIFSKVDDEKKYVKLYYSESSQCFHISRSYWYRKEEKEPFEITIQDQIISFFSKKEIDSFLITMEESIIPLSPNVKKLLDMYELLIQERNDGSSSVSTSFVMKGKYEVRWEFRCNFETGTWDVYDDSGNSRTAPKYCSLRSTEEVKDFVRFVKEGQTHCDMIFEEIKKKSLGTNRLKCRSNYEEIPFTEIFETISCEIKKKYNAIQGWYETVILRFRKQSKTFFLYKGDTLDEMFYFIENIAETFYIKENIYKEVLKFDPYFYYFNNKIVLLGEQYVDGVYVSYDHVDDFFSVSHDEEMITGNKEEIVTCFMKHFRKKYTPQRMNLLFESDKKYAYHRDKVTWLFGSFPGLAKWVLDEDVTFEEIEENVQNYFKEDVFVERKYQKEIEIGDLLFKIGEYSNYICVSQAKKKI